MDKLLITGSRGLLGGACARRLWHKYDLLVYPDNLLNEPRFRKWMVDNKPRYVIHCAAKVGGVKANRDNPVEFLGQNLRIQSNVIEASADLGVEKLVFIGTSCLYPRDCSIPVREESLLSGPFEPAVEAYAIAKLAGYRLCKSYSEERSKNFMTVCPSNLYGIGDNYGPSAHVIPALMSRLKYAIDTNTNLIAWGDGSAVREFLYVDDAADAIDAVLENWNKPDLINIGTGQGTTIKELVDTLVEVSGFKYNVLWDPSQPTGIPKKTFDVSKLTSLGWTPKTTLRKGLEKTWQSFTSTERPRIK